MQVALSHEEPTSLALFVRLRQYRLPGQPSNAFRGSFCRLRPQCRDLRLVVVEVGEACVLLWSGRLVSSPNHISFRRFIHLRRMANCEAGQGQSL